MRFDKNFGIQENRDNSGSIIDLDDLDNCRMRGTEKYPVKILGEIDDLEVDHGLLSASLKPIGKITLRLILAQLNPYDRIYGPMSYYMQFLFYDFNKAIHLFLFNAKVMRINDIPTIGHRRRYSLVITSIKGAEQAAYKVFETKHEGIDG